MLPSYQPIQELSISIPYHRNLSDRIFERTLPLLSILIQRLLPRQSLPREQLATLGIPSPPDLDRRLVEAALLEIFRILSGGWKRLDRSFLETLRGSTWCAPGGTLFLSMHHGQWEWLAGILSLLRTGTLCVAKSPGHPAGRWLLRTIRRKHGLNMVHDQIALRSARRHLEHSGLVAFLADQRPPGISRPGSWMGRPTSVSAIPDWLISSTSPRIWTGVLIPSGDRYILRLREWEKQLGIDWDALLDQEFRSLLVQSPWHHFGLWHHRLKSRIPKRPE